MIIFSGTREQCAALVIDLHRTGEFDAIMGASRTTVTVYQRRGPWQHGWGDLERRAV